MKTSTKILIGVIVLILAAGSTAAACDAGGCRTKTVEACKKAKDTVKKLCC